MNVAIPLSDVPLILGHEPALMGFISQARPHALALISGVAELECDIDGTAQLEHVRIEPPVGPEEKYPPFTLERPEPWQRAGHAFFSMIEASIVRSLEGDIRQAIEDAQAPEVGADDAIALRKEYAP
jgi:hypothetical protein